MNKFIEIIRNQIVNDKTVAEKSETLCTTYREWLSQNNLPQDSADEVLCVNKEDDGIELTQDQRDYLNAFIIVWNESEAEVC